MNLFCQKCYSPKKQTRPPAWTKRELLDGVFYQLKNGCRWEDIPKDLPPYSIVYWHYKQWRAAGCIEKLMTLLHEGQMGSIFRIVEAPERWTIIKGQIRRYLTLKFSYAVLYRVYPDRIVIVTIMSCRRDPSYWEDRL